MAIPLSFMGGHTVTKCVDYATHRLARFGWDGMHARDYIVLLPY